MSDIDTDERESVEVDRVRVPRESPNRRGGLKHDPRFWYVLSGSAVALVFLLIAALLQQVTAGFIILIVLVLCVLFTVSAPVFDGHQTVPITKLYRWWYFRHQRRLGQDYHLSRAISIAERTDPQDRGTGSEVPEVLGSISLVPYPTPEGVLATIDDQTYDTFSTAIRISGFPVLSHDHAALQARRLALAKILNLAASSGFHRLTWQDETLMGWEDVDPNVLMHYIQSESGLGNGPAEMQEVFRNRTRQMGAGLPTHLNYLVLTNSGSIDWKQTKAAGGPQKVLYDKSLKLQERLLSGGPDSPYGISEAQLLSYNDMVKVWHRRLDPTGAKRLEQHTLGEGELLDEEEAWPRTFDLFDSYRYRAGRTWHMCLVFTGFSDRMTPTGDYWKVLSVPVPKVVTVSAYPVGQSESIASMVREANLAISLNQYAESERGRANAFMQSDANRLLKDETEMADSGNYDFSFSAIIDVRGTYQTVDKNYQQVLSVIRDAGFKYRELEYEQYVGLEASLLAGRGLQPPFTGSKG